MKIQHIHHKGLFTAINHDDYRALSRIDRYFSKKAKALYTPLHKLMLSHHITVSDAAELLKISYQESFIHMHSAHISLRVLKRYSKILNISFKGLARQYGYADRTIDSKLNDPYMKIHQFLKDIRRAHHWSQSYVACYLGIRQTAVSGMENRALPTLNDIIKLAQLYNIKPIKLIRMCPKYKHIQPASPSYKLLDLAVKNDISFKRMSQLTGIRGATLKYFLLKKNSGQDRLPLSDVNRLCFAFNLDSNHFGPTEDRIMNGFCRYVKTSGMKSDSFGYRYNKLRCISHLTYQNIGKILNISPERAESYSKLTNPSQYVFNKIVNLFPTKYKYLASSVYQKIKN